MKILINYANNKYKKTQKVNSISGKWIGGFDRVISFSPDSIDSGYFEQHKSILSVKRGNGLWLWKPYFIKKVLDNANDGDIIFYCDSGSFFVRKINHLIESFSENENIWVSNIPLLEVNFTKPLCFEKMECLDDYYRCTNQIQGTFIMLRCCEESKDFVNNWLGYCEDYELLSPEHKIRDDKLGGEFQFISHREDQSILSLLCKKMRINPHNDPSQRGQFQEIYYTPDYPFVRTIHPDDAYKSVVFLHKFPKLDIIGNAKIIMRMYFKKYKYRKLNNTCRGGKSEYQKFI